MKTSLMLVVFACVSTACVQWSTYRQCIERGYPAFVCIRDPTDLSLHFWDECKEQGFSDEVCLEYIPNPNGSQEPPPASGLTAPSTLHR